VYTDAVLNNLRCSRWYTQLTLGLKLFTIFNFSTSFI